MLTPEQRAYDRWVTREPPEDIYPPCVCGHVEEEHAEEDETSATQPCQVTENGVRCSCAQYEPDEPAEPDWDSIVKERYLD